MSYDTGPPAAAREQILTVGALTRMIHQTLVERFSAVWVKGELSGVKRVPSGHIYFTLREGNDAVLSCAVWRTQVGRLSFDPVDGTEVEVFGTVKVYAPRGNYQLIVDDMRPAGLGALLVKLEKLKRRLSGEGLFDPERKRPLPRYPHAVGLVTSPSGAAVRDMVKVLRARWPSIRIVLAPVRVQGEGAADEISLAIDRFNRHGQVDVLIVGRGGGSLEDLWAFNEEAVVRAVSQSRIPVIAGVGHEVDQTLVELAADVRAATPSNAAEVAVRDRAEIAHRVSAQVVRMTRAARQAAADRRRRLQTITATYGFRRQRDLIDSFRVRVDSGVDRMGGALRRRLGELQNRLRSAVQGYGLRRWPLVLRERHVEVVEARRALTGSVRLSVTQRRTRVTAALDRLRALSPRHVLERGFCIARAADGTLLRSADVLSIGDMVSLELGKGAADTRVEHVRPGGTNGSEEETGR